MKSTQLKSIFDLKWSPRLFIEASAGTGKTYTIVGLIVRLLIEKKLDIDQILVMTFTKKATAELRDRIFRRLRDTVNYLQTGTAEEKVFMEDLDEFIKPENRDEIVAILTDAIRNFDESQVYTIHSFCQKILREEALLAGSHFDVEVIQQDEMLARATEDEWRLFIANHRDSEAKIYYAQKLFQLADTPAKLIKVMKSLFSRSYAEIEGEGHPDPLGYLNEVLTLRKKLVECWKDDEENIRRIIDECELSRFQQYLGGRLQKLVAFINDENVEIDAPDSLFYFTSGYLYDQNNFSKAKQHLTQEEHPFFEYCKQYHDLISQMGRVTTQLVRTFYERILTRREELSRQGQLVTYDDLLKHLNRALTDPDTGEKLAKRILEKVPYALIDEFQDTDPIQYSILDQIYPEDGDDSGLMMIGDPKQAIYAFRGADIYTYLRAKNTGRGEAYSLQQNFRSSPRLIEAVNRFFDGDNAPFIEKEIEYTDSSAGNPQTADHLLIEGVSPVPFSVSLHDDAFTNKAQAKNWAFRETVHQIVRLLNMSQEGLATIREVPVKAADIAVLVSSHKDASQIKRMLKRAGVGAVTYSHEKVFETFEANRLELLMSAVLEPNQNRKVNNALLNGFFGLSLHEIHSLHRDEKMRQGLLEMLQELNDTWHTSGFYAMFRALMYGNKSLAILAELDFSERVLTNILQLADITSKAEKEGKLSPGALLTWFRNQMADPDPDDEKTLLLESDQNLVKISTIHNSKGLEFPVVFCPTLWSGHSTGGKKDPFVVYNDPDKGKTVVNIDQMDSEVRLAATERSKLESIAEEIRKLYVALTRAQYYCSICWVTQTDSHFSGLGASMLGRDEIIKQIGELRKVSNKRDKVDKEVYQDTFMQLSARDSDLISIAEPVTVDTGLFVQTEEVSEEPVMKIYKGRQVLPLQRKLDSFSSLVYHKSEAGEPDYDQIVKSYSESLDDGAVHGQKLRDIFSFPRGATAGTAIHKLFELEGFDFNTVAEQDLRDEICEVLEAYRIEPEWADVMVAMMRDVASSAILGLDLSRVQRNDQIREMEFHFPSASVRPEELFDIIRDEKRGKLPETAPNRGFMTGFIDLIVQQDGKYFILDYKSNYLGDSADDYTNERLQQAMQEAGYDLQAYIYMVALVKYLRNRVVNFDYDKHIGGVAYLFVRGMKEGSENGVWFHKPGREKVEILEKKLSRR